jgi:hypothetical protein
VENQIRPLEGRRRFRNVPVLVADGDYLVRGEGFLQRSAELAARARDQDASRSDRIGDCVLQRCFTRGSSQGRLCSSGSAGSYSRVTW